MSMKDDRPKRALQMILEACDQQQYVMPYDVVMSGANGTQIAGRFDRDGFEPVAGDLASIGVLSAPLTVLVTDARGETVEFPVDLLNRDDGSPLPPIITYPTAWIKRVQ